MGASTSQPRVIAVVLTWNDVEMASSCVATLEASDYPELEILVVDNGSTEPCGERIRARHPGIELIVLPENRGFTGGSNAGLRRAVEMGADLVQLYNNDITVEPDTVSRLVAAFERYPQAGVTSPVMSQPGPDGEPIVHFYRGELDRERARHWHEGQGRPLNGQPWTDTESPFVPFCATLFRTSVLEHVGYLDESLGTCWEDFDLCVRIAEHRYRVMTVGDAHVTHDHGQTTGRASPYITYYLTRNRLICWFRYNSLWTILKNSPFVARSFWWQIRNHGLTSVACHKAFLRGVLDFVLRRRGEAPRIRSRDG